MILRTTTTALFLLALMGCGDDTAADSGALDAAGGDGGGSDGGASDGSPPVDGAPGDAGIPDAPPSDDAATSDAGDDAPSPDAGLGTAMSFFVSSTALTGHGNLGGLAAADAHCATLAAAAGAERTEWVAYLSTEGMDGPAVNAIDRIGGGPWYNADGDVFSPNAVALHPTIDPADDRAGYIAVKPADALFMDENGDPIAERSHDIFTGTQADGTVLAGETCQDWTSASPDDTGQVGHTDTPSNNRFSPSWNSAHNTAGCDTRGVIARGGVGLIYCFATD